MPASVLHLPIRAMQSARNMLGQCDHGMDLMQDCAVCRLTLCTCGRKADHVQCYRLPRTMWRNGIDTAIALLDAHVDQDFAPGARAILRSAVRHCLESYRR